MICIISGEPSRDVDELVDIVSAVPGQQLADALSSGSSNMGLLLKLKTLLGTFGHWDALYELYQVSQRAKEITRLYAEYPSTPEAFETWQADRDDLMDEFYTLTGAVKKY
ncbi:MAG: hypothetical protein J07HQX50_00596 [Haloquadratum sp. J07HQX50]|nr:MAG: hypothetical protein J07HQX50_00596 [Haloquadratum sp. J07HQX50]